MPLRRLIVTLVIALPFVFAASAQAYVYWGDPGAGTIGRANNDGSGTTDAFIHTGGTPVAVAVNASHIYWADESAGTIGRANIDGSEVEPSFITGINQPHGVAVSPTGIFWASFLGHEIGRANLDGTGKNLALVTGAGSPCSIAIDSGHIYWGNAGLDSYIGKASLSGGSAEPQWVPLETYVPCAIAVNSANVFFGDTGFLGPAHEIGRVGINGGTPDKSIIGEADGPCGMVVSGSKLYWANQGDGTIGVANTDATDPDEELVHTGGGEICGVAVDSLSSPLTPPATPPGPTPATPEPTPPNPTPVVTPPAPAPLTPTIRFVKLKPDDKRGTARLSVAVDEAGTVSLSGKGVAKATARARGAETVTLVVKAAKTKRAALKKAGRLGAKLTIDFKPSGGGKVELGKKVTLRERSARK
jgi:DNA-binding beta-propeller fold protein YncE